MKLDPRVCEKARQSRDARFDGQFFIAVKTTGIYCRPICPATTPKRENVDFYNSAAAATEAGYRPCLRCRPETAPGSAAWNGTEATVSRALKLIVTGALDTDSVEALATRLGVSSRHLDRLFQQHLGTSPVAIAQTQRLQRAKSLMDHTTLPLSEIALAAGYSSIRRFNTHFKQIYHQTPSTLRRKPSISADHHYRFKLYYRPPYDWASILGFLKRRATPGVEQIVDQTYTRNITFGEHCGSICVHQDTQRNALICDVVFPHPNLLIPIIERVKQLFDTTADPYDIEQTLRQDPSLTTALDRFPGLRVPGAWNSFEIAVRAIVGQQISVVAATTVMGRIAKQYGSPYDATDGLTYQFPTPQQLTQLDTTTLSMPQRRAQTIKDLAIAVDQDEIQFDQYDTWQTLETKLLAIKGIGKWTAQYIAMRAQREPDALLDTDLVLLKAAQQHLFSTAPTTPAMLREHAEQWRPWRAYASLYLWSMQS